MDNNKNSLPCCPALFAVYFYQILPVCYLLNKQMNEWKLPVPHVALHGLHVVAVHLYVSLSLAVLSDHSFVE